MALPLAVFHRKTVVDILNANCDGQEGIEKNYRLKPCRAKCLRTEF